MWKVNWTLVACCCSFELRPVVREEGKKTDPRAELELNWELLRGRSWTNTKRTAGEWRRVALPVYLEDSLSLR